jgi:hypothetical protein
MCAHVAHTRFICISPVQAGERPTPRAGEEPRRDYVPVNRGGDAAFQKKSACLCASAAVTRERRESSSLRAAAQPPKAEPRGAHGSLSAPAVVCVCRARAGMWGEMRK